MRSATEAADPREEHLLGQEKRVVFAGLARNCAHALPSILNALEQLAGMVDDWGYVFLENNSVDRTFRLLQRFDRSHQRGLVRSLGDLDQDIPLRTQRLAMLRNRCITDVFADPRLATFDFLIVLDMDGVNEVIDRHRLVDLMDCHVPRWSGVFANQRNRYYDIWALRHRTWCPHDCWKQVRLRPPSMSRQEAIAEYIDRRRIRLDPHSGFVPVESAFGGLGLYRLQDLRNCHYVGVDDEGHEICEHVSFHAAMRQKGGRLFIDTALLNGCGNRSHDREMGLLMRWKRSLARSRARRQRVR